MSYFETLGVGYQYNATSPFEADEAFKKSCNICCNTGRRISCDKCAISNAHTYISNILSLKA